MSVTYLGDLSTNLDIIRTRLQDIGGGVGILPGGANFSDATINAVISQQGSVGKAMVWLLRAALARWSVVAQSRTVGSRSETIQVDGLNKLLVMLESEFGEVNTGSFAIDFQRDDGYSEMNPYQDGGDSEYSRPRHLWVS
jgi:hypothetical protein